MTVHTNMINFIFRLFNIFNHSLLIIIFILMTRFIWTWSNTLGGGIRKVFASHAEVARSIPDWTEAAPI